MEFENLKVPEEYEIDDSELEAEGYDDPNAEDTIYVLNGRGKMIKMEVPDDD